MTDFIIKKFVKNHDNIHDIAVRSSYGKLSGKIGIAANIVPKLPTSCNKIAGPALKIIPIFWPLAIASFASNGPINSIIIAVDFSDWSSEIHVIGFAI